MPLWPEGENEDSTFPLANRKESHTHGVSDRSVLECALARSLHGNATARSSNSSRSRPRESQCVNEWKADVTARCCMNGSVPTR